MSDEPGRAQREAIAVVTSVPVAALTTLGVVAVLAVLGLLGLVDRQPQPFCQGEAMAPGDTCGRRGRRSVRTFQVSYERVLDEATGTLLAQRWCLAAVVVMAVVAIASIAVARRRDRRLVLDLAGPGPTYAHASRTAWRGVASVLGGSALVAVTVGLGLRIAIGGQVAQTVGWSIAVLGTLAALVLVWRGRSRGSEYVGIYREGVRLARRGQVRDVPWLAVHHFPGSSATTSRLAVIGETGTVSLGGATGGEVGVAVWQTWTSTALARLAAGERLDFGPLVLTGQELLVGGEAVALLELGSLHPVTRRKEPVALQVTTRTGAVVGDVVLAQVPNLAVLDTVLGWLVKVRVTGVGGVPYTGGSSTGVPPTGVPPTRAE
ncbi:hypothetical protein [Serinibacter arcticus]|nr:hypothetical protein [Serinibacter arcticus]